MKEGINGVITVRRGSRVVDVESCLSRLSKSNFRSGFCLKAEDIDYIKEKGIAKIKEHAADFIRRRLSSPPPNDGKQTPYSGHPVFIAQHATATCCRKCLRRWYGISPDRGLTVSEERFVVALIMAWIERQLAAKTRKASF